MRGPSCYSSRLTYRSQPNILIDTNGKPRLSDFSNCSFTKNTDPASTSTARYHCTIRWSAPERLDVSTQEGEPTTMSDVYSLSMVIVEVCLFDGCMMHPGSDCFCFQLMTGKMPFPELTDHSVIVMISKGKRPQKPRSFDAPGMTPAIWKIAQKCWHAQARERPGVGAVLESLESLVNSGVCAHKVGSRRVGES